MGDKEKLVAELSEKMTPDPPDCLMSSKLTNSSAKQSNKMKKLYLFLIVLLVLGSLWTGYLIYDSYKGLKIIEKDSEEIEKIRSTIQELREKIKESLNPRIDEFDNSDNDDPDFSFVMKRNSDNDRYRVGSIDRLKRDAAKIPSGHEMGSGNKKREIEGRNFLNSCDERRDHCTSLLNLIGYNIKAAENALLNINNVLQNLHLMNSRAQDLALCIQCHQYEQSNMISYQKSQNPFNSYNNPNFQNYPNFNNYQNNHNPNNYQNYQNNHNPNNYQNFQNNPNSNTYQNFQNNPNFQFNPYPNNNQNFQTNQNFNNYPNFQTNQNSTDNSNLNNTKINNNLNNDTKSNENLLKPTTDNKQKNQNEFQTIVLSSKTNISKIQDGAKITEVIRNQTIVEKPVDNPRSISAQKDEPTRYTIPFTAFKSREYEDNRASNYLDSSPSERMTTRDTKDDKKIDKQDNDQGQADLVTEDPSVLKTLERASTNNQINPRIMFTQDQQSQQRQQSPSIPTAETMIVNDFSSSNKLPPVVCYWPTMCYFRPDSSHQQPAPMFPSESAVVNSFQSAPGSNSWRSPANSNQNLAEALNNFFSSSMPLTSPQMANQQHIGPTGPGGSYPGRDSASQLPIQCSYVPHNNNNNNNNNNQGSYGHRTADNHERNQSSPVMNLKKPGALECPKNYTKCSDKSRCILTSNWCDGIVDCADASDEIACTCKDRITPGKHCDGYFDCPRGEDELGCFGCGNDSFSCLDWTKRNFKGNCVPLSERCDGIRQCQTGRDEMDCYVLTESYIDVDDISTIGHSSGYLFKNWHGKWYPACTSTELWADEACRGEIGSLINNPKINSEPVLRGHKLGPYISMSETGKVELVPECDNKAVFVKCPSIPCGTRLTDQYDQFKSYGVYEDTLVASVHSVQRNESTESSPATTGPTLDTWDLSGIEARTPTGGRIVGGRASQPQAWPFLVAIHRDGYFHCGGVVINENWVLTAAHCVDNHHSHHYQIFAGLLRRFSFSPMAQTRQAKFIVPHPEYVSSTMTNDLALIKLNEPLRFNRWIRATCLPIPAWGSIPRVNETCTTIGWGATVEHGPDPDHLREVEVPILSKCKRKHDQSNGIICAGWSEGGKDACQGDSGGPLMCNVPESKSRWYVAGIVSHGEGCARPNEPGVYTRVSYFYPWINETINLDHEPFGPKPLANCPGFKCNGEVGKCLPLRRRCDKKVDCLDAEDETDCYQIDIPVSESPFRVSTDRENYETTPDGVVEEVAKKNYNNPEAGIKPRDNKTVDDKPETPNYGDEKKLDNKDEKENIIRFATTQFEPNNEDVTDGITEVMDKVTESSNSDYGYYSAVTEINPRVPDIDVMDEKKITWQIPENGTTFFCTNISQGVIWSNRCDKKFDCEDGTDEFECTCRDTLMLQHPLSICDGRIDCEDKSDEFDCAFCAEDQYLCVKSTTCIPLTKRCDGKQDCPLHDDEKDCYALTDGETIELDIDSNSVLRHSGVLSVNVNNTWSIKCVNARGSDENEERLVADKYCSFIGLHKHKSIARYNYYNKTLQVKRDVNERNPSKFDTVLINDRLGTKLDKLNGSMPCSVLYLECELNFNRPVYQYLYRSNLINNETYLVPWEAAIFVDGKYHCPALLLSTNWALTTTRCTKDIDFLMNITKIMAGLSVPYKYVDGPHQEIRHVHNIKLIEQFKVALLRFGDFPITQHIQPIFINRRTFSLSGDQCLATGVDTKLKKINTGFESVKENCPSCSRCFKNTLRNMCPKNGSAESWSGFVACQNLYGWYPVAVFDEKDIMCGFTETQALTGIDELLPHITEVMENRYEENQFANCHGVLCPSGTCVPFTRVCDGIRDCRNGFDESMEKCDIKRLYCSVFPHDTSTIACGCSPTQLTCQTGHCISKDKYCDGFDDCGDGSDEPPGCGCRDYLQLTAVHRICNGVRDCHDKSDEAQEVCGCLPGSYKCPNSTKPDGDNYCFPYDYVCDGERDCPNGEDESLCRRIKSVDEPAGTGIVLKRAYGVWFEECFPALVKTHEQSDQICKSMGYKGGKLLEPVVRIKYGKPLTIRVEEFYSLDVNGLTTIVLKDDKPTATIVPQLDQCHRAYVECN